jgi:hypothetical protein
VPQLELATLAGCGLAIGSYPRFRYDASGGGGLAAPAVPDGEGVQRLVFDPVALHIPALNSRTTRVLGLPLPPGFEIAIAPVALAGTLTSASGELELQFKARFRFRIGRFYRAPDLLIDTTLSTGSLQSRRHRAQGHGLKASGEALLVGVATVAPSGDPWLDRFLGLPDEALALLRCRLTL